jgi:hypothetical protein
MGANGRRYAEHYCSWDSLAASYERVLQSVQSPRRGIRQIPQPTQSTSAASASSAAKQ